MKSERHNIVNVNDTTTFNLKIRRPLHQLRSCAHEDFTVDMYLRSYSRIVASLVATGTFLVVDADSWATYPEPWDKEKLGDIPVFEHANVVGGDETGRDFFLSALSKGLAVVTPPSDDAVDACSVMNASSGPIASGEGSGKSMAYTLWQTPTELVVDFLDGFWIYHELCKYEKKQMVYILNPGGAFLLDTREDEEVRNRIKRDCYPVVHIDWEMFLSNRYPAEFQEWSGPKKRYDEGKATFWAMVDHRKSEYYVSVTIPAGGWLLWDSNRLWHDRLPEDANLKVCYVEQSSLEASYNNLDQECKAEEA